MTRRPSVTKLLLLLLLALLAGGACAWRIARGNAGWQIRQVFPGAKLHGMPKVAIDSSRSVPEVIRMVIPSYYRANERIGFAVSDATERLDLQQRFSRLSHLKIYAEHLARCRVSNLCPISGRGFPGFISFEDCDFSELPPEQLARLRPDASTSLASAKVITLGNLQESLIDDDDIVLPQH